MLKPLGYYKIDPLTGLGQLRAKGEGPQIISASRDIDAPWQQISQSNRFKGHYEYTDLIASDFRFWIFTFKVRVNSFELQGSSFASASRQRKWL